MNYPQPLGQLYVHIIEAQINPVTFSTFVRFLFEGNTQETSHAKDTYPVTWNQEFVIPVQRLTNPIVFTLFRKRLLSSSKLGDGTFDIQTLQWDQPKEVWIPIQGADLIDCQIRVVLCFQPIPLYKPVTLPEINIVLERYEYFPGEIVRGYVTFYPKKKRNVRGLRLRFSGATFTRKVNGDNFYVNTIIKTTSTLHGFIYKSKDAYCISQGEKYIYFFSFKLPISLPPTMETRRSFNGYEIKVYCDQFGFDLTAKKEIIVMSSPPSNIGVVTHQFASSHVTVQLRTRNTIIEGTQHKIEVTIDNQSEKDLSGLRVRFQNDLNMYGDKKLQLTTNEITHNVVNSTFPIKPGQRFIGTIYVDIPENSMYPNIHSRLSRIDIKTSMSISMVHGTYLLVPDRIEGEFDFNIMKRIRQAPWMMKNASMGLNETPRIDTPSECPIGTPNGAFNVEDKVISLTPKEDEPDMYDPLNHVGYYIGLDEQGKFIAFLEQDFSQANRTDEDMIPLQPITDKTSNSDSPHFGTLDINDLEFHLAFREFDASHYLLTIPIAENNEVYFKPPETQLPYDVVPIDTVHGEADVLNDSFQKNRI